MKYFKTSQILQGKQITAIKLLSAFYLRPDKMDRDWKTYKTQDDYIKTLQEVIEFTDPHSIIITYTPANELLMTIIYNKPEPLPKDLLDDFSGEQGNQIIQTDTPDYKIIYFTESY